jgi:hypothetical protein
MATTTANYGLRKPDPTDTVNVTTDLSANFDLIDTAIRGNAVSISTNTANIAANTTAIGLRAIDTLVVHLAGTETISGAKTFTGGLSSTLTGATSASRYAGGTTGGPPTTGTFATGDYVIAQTGNIWVCTAGGTPGTWSLVKPVEPLAKALGYINWNFGPSMAQGGSATTSQRGDVVALWLPHSTVITNVCLTVTTAGAGTAPTGFYVGLATAAKIVAQSANLNASALLTSTGTKQFALSSTYTTNTTDSASGLYYVLILQNGAFATTPVQFLRGNAATIPGGVSNPAFGNIGTALTTPPANGTAITIATTAGIGWQVGVS